MALDLGLTKVLPPKHFALHWQKSLHPLERSLMWETGVKRADNKEICNYRLRK